jgi:putative restriction endonuclease
MKAIFTAKQTSAYDDLPEVRYHFPRTYLRQVESAQGDLIVYYEPRRTSTDANSRGGRQAYFATARVSHIEVDPHRKEHYYAYVSDYIDFDAPVPFSSDREYFESGLMKTDGTTNKGAFGRAVRPISDAEYALIVAAGFPAVGEASRPAFAGMSDSSQAPFEHPLVTSLVTRPFRDRAFARHVESAYGGRCAITGIRLINGGGRFEAQAAHIQPVERCGPDSVRNGVALSGTIHWMFDRGLISVDDDHRLLKAKDTIPDDVSRLFHPSGRLLMPEAEHLRPHPTFLRFHRENVFKG